MASFLGAFTRFLQRTRDRAEFATSLTQVLWWSLKDDCFTASRFGIDAMRIVHEEGDVLPLREATLKTLASIEPHAVQDENGISSLGFASQQHHRAGRLHAMHR
jgi:gamma-glutamyl:cysteine ligase YbdK (ATP-grasp superfamily)